MSTAYNRRKQKQKRETKHRVERIDFNRPTHQRAGYLYARKAKRK